MRDELSWITWLGTLLACSVASSALAEEISNARIWAGFHYRFSSRVGTDMGRKIGQYIAQHAMQPTNFDESR
jgi:hypothetical protein